MKKSFFAIIGLAFILGGTVSVSASELGTHKTDLQIYEEYYTSYGVTPPYHFTSQTNYFLANFAEEQRELTKLSLKNEIYCPKSHEFFLAGKKKADTGEVCSPWLK